MALRLHRVTDEQWQRLARPPARTSIGAIEIELRALEGSRPTMAERGEYREAATG